MSDPFLGEIIMFGGNFAPRGWALCEGQLLPISQNSALFSILGTTYGGDGRTTFGLPDLRGRVPMGPGNGPGLTSRHLGEKSGVENVTLTQNQMPAHSHTATAHAVSPTGNSNDAAGNLWADDAGTASATYSSEGKNATMSPEAISVQNTGGSRSHTNVQPFLCINFIIALVGVFPSRN
ncbi:MAG: phage tail protein [Gammaproteobacteria bacterium]|nr:phage tail protein [Gammaproteobacteria bacterium]